MKIYDVTDLIKIFEAEDGTKFFTYAEALSHEGLAYIAATLKAFGHGDVTSAVNEVEKLYPEVHEMISKIVEVLRHKQSTLIETDVGPRIDSVLAPANIAAHGSSDTATGTTVVPKNPDATYLGGATPADPDKSTPTPPPPPAEPERVTRPDTTPRPGTAGDTPSETGPGDTAGVAPSAASPEGLLKTVETDIEQGIAGMGRIVALEKEKLGV